MKIKTLKTKVLVWFGTIVAVILIVFSIAFRYFLNNSINDNVRVKFYHVASNLITSLEREKTILDIEIPPKFQVMIFKEKKLLYSSKAFSLQNISELIKKKDVFYIDENDDDETMSATYILKKQNYIVVVHKNNIDNKIENFEDTLFVLDVILLLLLIFVASELIDKILLPIKNITKIAKDISVNNFLDVIPENKENLEIQELVNAFNEMILRLKEGVENLERFNNDVSHELKTPLTVIKGEIEVTLRKLRNPQEYQKSMQVVYDEAYQMQMIVENLLFLTRYSKQNIEQSFEECCLDSVLLEVIDKFNTLLLAKNIHLIVQNIEPLVINANTLLIHSIFSNLLDNAIKYSANDTNIRISLYKNKNVYFEIEDEGIGIKERELCKITEKFYRVDTSRSKNIKGFGLGLSIVENSLMLHNAQMQISSIFAKGTKIIVKF